MKKIAAILTLLLLVATSASAMILAGVLSSYRAPQAPNAPTGVTATAGNTQNTVSWSAGATDGTHDAPTSYTLYGGTSASPTSSIYTGSATSYTHTGLTNGTPYYYRLTASNAVGTSGYTSPDAIATPDNITYLARADFNSGTVDSGFSARTSTANGGTASITSNSPAGLVTITTTGIGGYTGGAVVTYNTALPSNQTWTVRTKGHLTGSTGTELSMLKISTSASIFTPTADSTANAQTQIGIRATGSNTLDVFYFNNTGTNVWLTSGAAWTSTTTHLTSLVTDGTDYVYEIQSQNNSGSPRWRATVYAADGTTQLLQSPWVAWSATKAVSTSQWAWFGDADNDYISVNGAFDYMTVY